jgi:hypothetical protein
MLIPTPPISMTAVKKIRSTIVKSGGGEVAKSAANANPLTDDLRSALLMTTQGTKDLPTLVKIFFPQLHYSA